MKTLTLIVSIALVLTSCTLQRSSVGAYVEEKLTPGIDAFQEKWIENQTYKMKWFIIKDTARIEIGEVSTQVVRDKKYLTLVTQVKMKISKAPWVDTTIADAKTLKPIYHSSYNMQRDMVLHFGKIVTGFYNDKIKQKQTIISDTTTEAYFDSNLYPALVAWLPLKDGYKKDLSIYDYNPLGKIGVIKASVLGVKSGIYQTNFSGSKNVWIVTVADEIGGSTNDLMIYYIDKDDRRLWNQEINAGGRKMIMQLIE